jgi:hypothetical protein
MGHIALMAAFEDSRFVAGNYAIPGQQPIRVAAAYWPYYQLQTSFGPPTCSLADHRDQLARTAALVSSETAAGHAVPPIYFFLVRPSAPATLTDQADLVARGVDYELYAVRN